VAVPFGEFLVAEGHLDRNQLLHALQLQDRMRGVRLGESAALLGYLHVLAIEQLYERFVTTCGHHRPRRIPRERALTHGHRDVVLHASVVL
jgi:hypothetical protein